MPAAKKKVAKKKTAAKKKTTEETIEKRKRELRRKKAQLEQQIDSLELELEDVIGGLRELYTLKYRRAK